MSTIEVVEKKAVNMASLKEELADIKKRDGELSFRGQKTEEYLAEFHLLKAKKAEELFSKINDLGVPRLKDSHINKVVDTLPTSVPELKVILQGYAVPVTNDNMKKIVDIVAEYAEK